jgi:hypothetical protein
MGHRLVNRHITGHLLFVLVSEIENPVSCVIRSVVRFLRAKTSVLRKFSELCAVQGQNVMSEGTVRQWCRIFKDGPTNVHDEERSCWSSVDSDDLVQSVDQEIFERRRFRISELSCESPETSRSLRDYHS